jgi:proline dehydrogenase
MELTELALEINEFADWARELGDTEVEQFWNSVAAKIAEDIFRSQESVIDKEAVQMFQLSGQAYYDHLKKKVEQVAAEDRPVMFETIRSAVNAAQERGSVSLAQADIVRKITNQVEQEMLQGE